MSLINKFRISLRKRLKPNWLQIFLELGNDYERYLRGKSTKLISCSQRIRHVGRIAIEMSKGQGKFLSKDKPNFLPRKQYLF